MSEHTGRFVVTHVDAESAVLQDVDTGQVLTLSENPGLDAHEVLEATVAAVPPVEVAYRLLEVDERHTVDLEESPEPPTRQAREVAADQEPGEATTLERAGAGEVDVVTVPADRTEQAVADVLADEATIVRAARLDVGRVEVRSDDGVVSVRYLP